MIEEKKDSNFADWRWQMQNSVTNLAALSRYAAISEQQQQWLKENFLINNLPFSLTPYFASLIEPKAECPIFAQVVSSANELKEEKFLVKDPLGEEIRQNTPHLVHRYPDRVLFLATDRCASYCRFCTRKRWVGQGPTPKTDDFQKSFEYIKNNSSIKEIIFSGGDPLILSNEKIKYLLKEAFSIAHVKFIRFHSRILSFLPMRIDEELSAIFSAHKPIYFVTHFNHPKEITKTTKEAIDCLRSAGVILLNQSVMLKGINDSEAILSTLFYELVSLGIKPYYLHQCDLIKGSAHFRVPIKRSLSIFEKLRGNISGLCMPTFMIETPGGSGKNALMPNPIVKEDEEYIYLKGFDGKIAAYPKE